ncbi:MAG: potassium-transporting ATPase subunit C [Deltaproteobacteria bacterium]|jgi:K+-transporting ATPase ATPase C chain|nr:potassium-transporting ATPase subunit C [Deltaproteobacteria bacterium]
MGKELIKMIKLTVLLYVVCSLAYTFLIWGIGKIAFPFQAGGSIIYNKNSKPVGSLLIGEKFTSPYIFNGRPSYAGNGYNGTESGGSNYAPTNGKYIKVEKKLINKFLKENPAVKRGNVPVDMVTGSGSGLGPYISIAAALDQVPRISSLTGVSKAKLYKIVKNNISYRKFGIFGTPGVNTVKLNLKLSLLLKKSDYKLYKRIFKGLA